MDIELNNYLNEIRNYDRLSNEEQKELMLKFKLENNQESFLKVYNSNLLIVVKLAFKYYYPFLHFSIMDLIQEGNIALLKAMNSYDIKYINTKSITSYAYYIIEKYMDSLTKDSGQIIRIPRHKFSELKLYNQKFEELFNKFGRKPTYQELANELNFTRSKVKTLAKINLILSIESLNKKVEESGDEVMEFIPSKEEDFSEQFAIDAEEEYIKNYIFSFLTETQKRIINLRFGFDDLDFKGYQEVADILGYKDRRNVESVERRTLKKIKSKLEAWDYYNEMKSR